ncbi:MAG: Signal recognition particle receptor protein FtsY [Labilithrix sp.]|nr:Signal recognition particle receptor protein FtsY [Labilithrix sp.]
MDNLRIVLVVIAVVAVLVYLLFFRKKTEAPPAAADKRDTRGPRTAPADTTRSVEKAQAGRKPPLVESLPSTDVLPSDSIGDLPVPVEPTTAAPPVASKKDVAGLRKGLAATRGGFMARLKAIFVGKTEIDPAILEQMEEVMLTSDVGVKTTHAILARLRERLAKNELSDSDAVWAALRAEATRILTESQSGPPGPLSVRGSKQKPIVVLMVGVNGVGKTTTIGKLATKWNADGKKVILAAGDTFRAAAVQQLEVWGKRVGAEVVKGKEGSDPGAVAFEATKRAQEGPADVLLVDTAGRLHTKVNLMDEIKKVKRTIAKAMDGAPHETLLVLDATTGQNALTQAALFKDALELTGLILTKLDGTAKGGVVLGVCDELKVPVRYIGLGERAEDLREFVAVDFVEALFGRDDDEVVAA